MKRLHVGATAAVAVLALAAVWLAVPGTPAVRAESADSFAVEPRPMPEFPSQADRDWLNSEPLQPEDLRGDVVLLEIWTTA